MSYVGNIFRSFKFALPKIAEQQLGNLASFAKVIDYKESDEMKNVLDDAQSFIKNDIRTPLKVILKDIDRGIKTGNIYTQEDEFGGLDIDLGGFDDIDISDSSSSSDTVEESGDLFGTEDTSGGDTSISTTNIRNISKHSSVVNNVTSGSGAKEAALTGSMLTTGAITSSGKHVVSATVHATQALLDSNRMMLDQTVAFHHESGRFFERNVGTLSEIGEILGAIRESQDKANAFYGIRAEEGVDDIFTSDKSVISEDGKFNAANYLGALLERSRNETSMFKLLVSDLQGEGQARNRVMDELGGGLFSSSPFKAISNLNQTLGEVPSLFFDRLREAESSSNPVISKFAKFFGVEENQNVTLDMGKYEKGAVPFDGITRRSIVDVIPNLLSQILNKMNGGSTADQLVYDYETGRFSTQGQVMEDNRKALLREAEGNFSTDLDAIKSGMTFEGKQEAAFDQLSQKIMLELSRSSKVLREDTDLSSIIGKDLADTENARLIKERFDSMSATEKALFHTNRRKTRNAIVDQNKDIATNQSSAIFAAMEADDRQRKALAKADEASANGGAVDSPIAKATGDSHLSLGNVAVDKFNEGGLISNPDGTVTVGSIAKSPLKALSKASDKINSEIGKFFFGSNTDEADKASKVGMFAKMNNSLGRMLFGEDENGESRSFTNVFMESMGKWYSLFSKNTKAAFKELVDSINSKVIAPLISKISDSLTTLTNPIKDFIFGTEDKKGFLTSVEETLSGAVSKVTDKLFRPIRTSLFGEDGKGGVVGSIKSSFNDKVLDPFKTMLFGSDDPEKAANALYGSRGMLGNISDSFKTNLWNPFKESLFGTDDELRAGSVAFAGRGLFGHLKDQFNVNFISPAKSFLFGDENADADASEVKKLGVLGFVKDRMTTRILDPMKTYLFGDSEDPNNLGLFQRMGSSIANAFNISKGEGAGLLESIGAKISEKFVKPLSMFLNDPETGLFARMGNKFGEVLAPIRTKLLGDGTDENTGILGVIGKKFDTVTMSFNKFLFGDSESGKLGLFTKVEDWFSETIAEPFKGFMFGEDGKGGIWGDIKGGINSFMFGDDNGKEGFYTRIIQPSMDFLNEEIVNPFKDTIAESWAKTKDFVREEVFEPLKGTLQPFISELGFQFDKLKDFVFVDLKDGIVNSFGLMNSQLEQTLGVNIGEIMKQNVLDPIKDTLSKVKEGIGKALGAIVKFPVDVLKGAADDLKIKHLLEGKGGYIDGDEKKRLLDRYNSGRNDKDKISNFGSQAAIKDKPVSSVSKVAGGDSANIVNADKAKSATENSEEGFFSRLFGGKGNKSEKATREAVASAIAKSSVPSVASSNESDNLKSASAAKASVSGTSNNVAKDKGTEQSATKSTVSKTVPEKIFAKVNGIKNDTGKIFSFIRSNLQGVGHNIHKIAKKLAPDVKVLGAENEARKGLMGKLFDIIKSPFSLLGSLAKNMGDAAVGVIRSAASAAAEIIKAPFKLIGGLAKGVGQALGAMSKAIGPVLAGLGNFAKGLLGAVGEIARGIGSATKKVFQLAGEGVLQAGRGLLKATGAIGELIVKSVLPAVMQLSKSLISLTANVITTAATLMGSFVKGVGRVLGIGRGKGGASSRFKKGQVVMLDGGFIEKIKDTVNVNVVGGKLDYIGKGMPSPVSKVSGKTATEQLAEKAKAREAANDANFRENLVSNTGSTSGHLGKLRKSFSGFVPALLTGLSVAFAGLKTFFMGKLITPLWGFLTRLGGGLGGLGRKAKGLGGKVKGLGSRAMGAVKNVKGLGPAMVAGLAGAGINMAADEYMDEGVGKEVVKTGGSALAYGATGAMIGSIIPGLGTAVGGAIGAGVGAVVENWDHITKAAGSAIFGKDAEYDKDGKVKSYKRKGLITEMGSFLFGKNAEFDANGNVISPAQDSILGKFYGSIFGSDEEITTDGQTLKKGQRSITQKLSYGLSSGLKWLFGDGKDGKGIFTRTGEWFGSAIYNVGETLGSWGDSIAKFPSVVSETVSGWGDSMGQTLVSMRDGLLDLPNTLMNKADAMWDSITANVTSFFSDTAAIPKKIWDGVKNIAGSVLDFISNPIKSAIDWWNSDDEDEGDNRSWYQKLLGTLDSHSEVNKVTKASPADMAKADETKSGTEQLIAKKRSKIQMLRNSVFDKGVENGVIDPTASIIRTRGTNGSITEMWIRDAKGNTVIIDGNGKVISTANGKAVKAEPPTVKRADPTLEAVNKAALAKDTMDETAKHQKRNHAESLAMWARMEKSLGMIADNTGEFKDKELSVTVEQQNSKETVEQPAKVVEANSSTVNAAAVFSGQGRAANTDPRYSSTLSAQRIAKGN